MEAPWQCLCGCPQTPTFQELRAAGANNASLHNNARHDAQYCLPTRTQNPQAQRALSYSSCPRPQWPCTGGPMAVALGRSAGERSISTTYRLATGSRDEAQSTVAFGHRRRGGTGTVNRLNSLPNAANCDVYLMLEDRDKFCNGSMLGFRAAEDIGRHTFHHQDCVSPSHSSTDSLCDSPLLNSEHTGKFLHSFWRRQMMSIIELPRCLLPTIVPRP